MEWHHYFRIFLCDMWSCDYNLWQMCDVTLTPTTWWIFLRFCLDSYIVPKDLRASLLLDMASHLVCEENFTLCNTAWAQSRQTSLVQSKIASIAPFTTRQVVFVYYVITCSCLTFGIDRCMSAWRPLLSKAYQTTLFANHLASQCIPQPCSWPCL